VPKEKLGGIDVIAWTLPEARSKSPSWCSSPSMPPHGPAYLSLSRRISGDASRVQFIPPPMELAIDAPRWWCPTELGPICGAQRGVIG
jgi:hypothetical protein